MRRRGTNETTATTAAPATTATTAAPPTTTTAAPATTTSRVAAQEPITIKYATTFIETESGGKIIQHFCDYVEDETAGAVTFDIFFGGTLGTNMEELGLVSSGSVDMISFGHPPLAIRSRCSTSPCGLRRMLRGPSTTSTTWCSRTPTPPPLIQEEAATNNVIYLGFTAGGGNVFIAKEPFTKLSDLVGKKFGAGGSIPAFEALGYTVVQTFPPDTYENLSRGVIEATQMGFVPTVNLKWYEVCKYYMFDGTYAAGNAFTVNLDTWAKLTPETQAILYEAAAETEAFSLELDAADTEASVKMLTDAGVTVGTLRQRTRPPGGNLFDVSAADCMTRAEKLGIVDNMTTVLKAAAEFTKVEWTPPAK